MKFPANPHDLEGPVPMKILGILEVAVRGSYNWGLLEATKELLPDNTSLEIFDTSRFPLFTQDNERDPPEEISPLQAKDTERGRVTLCDSRTQLHDHRCHEKRDRMGQPTRRRQFMEGKTCGHCQRIVGS